MRSWQANVTIIFRTLDEMRIIALGTGRPFVRRGQANCSWLIELGNSEKFVFDFGSGSQANFTALEIPHQDITAYFATHLHADHVGDFAQVWIGSWAGGRVKPLVVYGPSGPEPKYGTEFFVRKQMESLAWDTHTRLGLLPDAGAEVEVQERFAKLGMLVPSLSRQQFAASLKPEAEFWRETVERGKISIG
jgi:ribonuclease Z